MAHIFDVFALLDDDDDDFYFDHPQRRRGRQQHPQQQQQQMAGRWVRADWIEAPDSHVIKLDMPGVKKDQVHVDIEDGRNLVISGEKHKDKPADKESKVHCYERFAGAFSRSFRLPRNAKLEEIHARLEDGVLCVAIPKTAEVKPAKRTVEIHGFGGEGRSTDISTGTGDQPRVTDSGPQHQQEQTGSMLKSVDDSGKVEGQGDGGSTEHAPEHQKQTGSILKSVDESGNVGAHGQEDSTGHAA